MKLKNILKSIWGIAAGGLGIIVILSIYFVLSRANSPEVKARQALDLGERYLLELDYEQAIVQFNRVIEIADQQSELLDLGDHARERRDDAAQSGTVSLLQTPGSDLEDAVNWLDANGCLDVPSAYFFTNALSFLQELEALCAAEKYDTVFALLADSAYKEIVSGIMGVECNMVLLNDETGMMTAIYRMEVETENFAGGDGLAEGAEAETAGLEGANDDQTAPEEVTPAETGSYMVYYGAHTDGIREGEGIWLAYQNGNNYLARGTWVEDRPEGEFETRSWQADLNATVTYRVISGNVTNGLWDGSVSWSFERGDVVDSYTPTFEDGIWQILREEDGQAVVAENEDGGILIAAEPEKSNGIAGYAEAA